MRLLSIGVLSLIGLFSSAVDAQTIKDKIIASVTLEEAASPKHSEFTFIQDSKKVEFLIDRVLPDRTHLIQKDSSGIREFVIIGKQQYLHEAAQWKVVPVGSRPTLVPTMQRFFNSSLTELIESPPIKEATISKHVYRGLMKWQNGKSAIQGKIEIQINDANGLPSDLKFTGLCGIAPCSWNEHLEYGNSIHVDAPL